MMFRDVGFEKAYQNGGDGGQWGPAFREEPFPHDRKQHSERPGTVKGAPLLGAANRTLDGEDRFGTMSDGGKAPSLCTQVAPKNGPLADRH